MNFHSKFRTAFILLFMFFIQIDSQAQMGLQWAKSMGGKVRDLGYTILNDSFGNTYNAGYFSDTVDFDPGSGIYNLVSVDNNDIFIQKLDVNGNFVWAKSAGSAGQDAARGITLDNAGNVYITGYYQGKADFNPDTSTVFNLTPAGQLDAFIWKLDKNGNFLWAGSFGSTSYENGDGITIDAQGNIIFCGYFNGTADFNPGAGSNTLTSAGNNDIFICKLSANGSFIWAKRMGGTGMDIAYKVVLDKSGNIYTTGRFSVTADFNPGTAVNNRVSVGGDDIFVSKLDSAGNYIWAKSFGSTGTDEGCNIGLDSLNNVYTTGWFSSSADFDPGTGVKTLTSAGGNDVFISKLDSNGVFVWANKFGSTKADVGNGIFVKPSGDVLCAGYFSGSVDFDPGTATFILNSKASSTDAFALKLNASGNFIFAIDMGDTLNTSGTGIYEDTNGSIVVSGYFSKSPDFNPGAAVYKIVSNGDYDIFTCKYHACSISTSSINVSCCNQYQSPSGKNYLNTGTYHDTISNYAGCDSIITINLTVNHDAVASIYKTVCNSYTVPSGDETYTLSGIYHDTIPTFKGCDSMLTINMTVNHNAVASIYKTVCNSYTVPSGDETYTLSGIYHDTIPTFKGCDSLLTINLTVNHNAVASIFKTVCNSYTVPSGDETYTLSGIYHDTIPTFKGCDSMLTINLTINNIDNSVYKSGDTLKANASPANYQWLDCDHSYSVIQGANNIYFVSDKTGNFAVEITQNNCKDTSNCYSVILSGIKPILNRETFVIYPNPFSSFATITFNEPQMNLMLKIIDIFGNEIKAINFSANKLILFKGEMKPGIYIIQIMDEKKTIAKRKIIIL